ncbi:MAG: DUF2079 domain-containing protein [Acidimicrobiales bacterium]
MSEIPYQRRLERAIVRFQARLEGGPGDRWIPSLVAIGLTVWLARLGLDRLKGFDAGADLAGYSQSLWLLGQLTEPRASLFGTDVHVLELRWSFILYPLAVLGRFATPAKVLIVSEAMALGLAVFPLWRLAREVAKLRVGAASALVVAYALHPATHRLAIDDFHPVVLAVPAIIGLAYFGKTKRWVWYWGCVALALACRADLGLAVALWGFVLLGDGERRAGLWTLGVGSIWSLALLLVGQPLLSQAGGGTSTGYNGQSLGEVVLGSLRNPLDSLQSVVAQENLALIVALLAPVIFLPLLSLRYLLPALPLAGLYLLAGTSADTAFAERSAMLLAFVMIAATFALNRLGNMGVDRVFLDVRLLTTLTAASILLFVSTSPTSPYENPWNWDELDATDRAIERAVNRLDDDIPVRASPSALPALSERPWLYPLSTDSQPTAVNMGFPAFTRAVLVVEREIPERTAGEREEFDRNMVLQGFELGFDVEGVALYVR